MEARPPSLPATGAATVSELYAFVGAALSWWEASEDALLRLFREVCDDVEPLAARTYVQAPRAVLYAMLHLAFETYAHRFEPDEVVILTKTLKALDRLASRRNEMAHGFVAGVHGQVGEQVETSGHYLLPSQTDGGHHERSFRFHHTSETIRRFIDALGHEHGKVLDIYAAVARRGQEQQFAGGHTPAFFALSQRIARREIAGSDAVDRMRALIARLDALPERNRAG